MSHGGMADNTFRRSYLLTYFKLLEGARASTGLCVDVSSGVMISMKVIKICSRSQ